jgi:ABC-type branched-subunit amino acid transport system ATPase component
MATAPADAPAVLRPRRLGRGLVIEGMSLTYSGVTAVSDVSLAVEPGELVGLIGPNGAGKTSLIDAITGYARGAIGEVHLAGQSLRRLPPHRRAKAGLVRTFQNLEIFNDLTVAENIDVAVRASGRGAVAMGREHLLPGLAFARDRLASELSQGDRRMLALARAVACRPEVLVLDEPAAGLDTGESRELGRTLRSLVAGGIGMLLVDHDMSLVLTVCDRILVLDHGVVIAEGDPQSIRNDELVRQAYLGG